MSTPKPPPAMTADEFRAIFDATGLTQQRAADRLGVSKSSVFGWLEKRSPISAERAALIRERLQGEKPGDPGAAG